MTADDGHQLRALFLAARAREPAQREAFLQQACPEDAALRAEVLALLGAAPLPDASVVEVITRHGVPPTPAAGPQRFGRFELHEHLGAGGMGSVDRAFDPVSQRWVAIKRLRHEWLAGPHLVARFEREVRAAARLAVRGLCPVFETGSIDGVRYCVMPLVPGITLEQQLRQTPNPPDAAAIRAYVVLFAKVAQALHHAHEAGLVHRDLKPANVMIQPDGEPMVLDFGLVQDQTTAEPRLTTTGQLPGTPSYMAPEQVRGEPTDCRTDVHALGVMLFESVCGKRPFAGDSTVELFTHIEHQPLPSPRRCNRAVPRSLATVLAVAAEKAPARRYRTATAFADDLARVLAQRPVQALRPPLWRRVRDWGHRNRTATTILVVIVAGLLVSAVLQRQRTGLLGELRATIAHEQALRATANDLRATAEDRLADFEGLAALTRTAQAVAAAQMLQPAWPERIESLQEWLAHHGSAMAADRDRLAATIARLHQRAETMGPKAPPSGLSAPRPPELSTLPPAEQVLVAELQRGLAALDQHLGSGGLREQVQSNLEWARGITTWTTAHPQQRVSWAEAAAAIARADGTTASRLYAGAIPHLAPVLGFVPIGRNPRTLLWEFYDLRSAYDPGLGDDPANLPIPTHNADGSFPAGWDGGMVFVLLPGGHADLGAQRTAPGEALYCATARPNEALRSIDLAPFFLARFEMTQSQWRRLSLADNPSRLRQGTNQVQGPRGAPHPVENVSPHESRDLLHAFGLRLPSEWEWEYACRAGTTTPWHTGAVPHSLLGHANLADAAFYRARRMTPRSDFDDGFVGHAPVGSGAGNPFGCYDMHGNVAEPCAEAEAAWPTRRILRGGGWTQDHEFARSSYRSSIGWDERFEHVGVRAARSLR